MDFWMDGWEYLVLVLERDFRTEAWTCLIFMISWCLTDVRTNEHSDSDSWCWFYCVYFYCLVRERGEREGGGAI